MTFPHTCDGCGEDKTVLLNVGYGRFCRRCVFPPEGKRRPKKRRHPKVDL